MGRRTIGQPRFDVAKKTARFSPEDAKAVIATQFYRMMTGSGVNVAQFTAQKKAAEMVEFLVGMVEDITVAPTLRRQCAIDVLTYAYGPVMPWKHDGQQMDPQGQTEAGATVTEVVDAARVTAQLHTQLSDLIARQVPVENWPAEVREIAGGLVAVYSRDETD